jgi:NTP pyrophosphatase (non-canonical NTP hydrolase)
MDQDTRQGRRAWLQELQRRFDRSRGFEDLPFESGHLRSSQGGSPETQRENLLRQLEYVALGVAGEAGELVGVVKNWRRSIAMRTPIDPPLHELYGELGDIYAYLLKTANILGRDLEQIYLEKAARNILRFPHKPKQTELTRVVSIIGPPGAGKTSAARFLNRHLLANTEVYVEDYARNPHLAAAKAEQPARDASQRWFMDEYRSFLGVAKPPQVVLDQDPSAVVLVYSGQFRDDGQLSDAAYTHHLCELVAFETELESRCEQRSLIHLFAAPAVLAERSRQKDANLPLDQEWLAKLAARFRTVYESPNVLKVIDTTHLSQTEVGEIVLSSCQDYFQQPRTSDGHQFGPHRTPE